MQPHPTQLPRDDAQRPQSKDLKKGALWLLLLLVAVVALIAFLLPQRQVEGRNAPLPTQHQVTSPAYSNPKL